MAQRHTRVRCDSLRGRGRFLCVLSRSRGIGAARPFSSIGFAIRQRQTGLPLPSGLGARFVVGMRQCRRLRRTFFIPAALNTNFGLDAVGAAYLISTAYIFAIFANLACGFLIDRFNRWAVMAVILTVIITSALAMTSSSLMVFRVAVTLVIGLGLVCSNQVYGLGADVLRGRETGPVMGIVSLGAGVFGYVGPQLLGALRDWTGGFDAGWYAMAALAAVALVVVIALSRSSVRAPVAITAD